MEKTKKVRFYETHLFRALTNAITSLSPRFLIEEYHGSTHQVAFGGHGGWARDIARCELSDLLIITFTHKPKIRGRMTFLQAKRSLSKFCICCHYPEFNLPLEVAFRANLEQWDLLNRRPFIIGIPPFDPPPELLSGALLASIGSFGVFHRRQDKSVGFLFASADTLSPTGQPVRKHGNLEVLAGPSKRSVHGYEEMRLACCIQIFGLGLFGLKIGTPFDYDKFVSITDNAYRKRIRSWLGGIIRGHILRTDEGRPGALSLLRFLDQSPEGPTTEGPLPNVLLIRADP